jgi:UTP:GlnB (protein PII) uridylyltransferase
VDRGGESPLEQLGASSGRAFPNLLSARERTASGLEARRSRLAGLAHDGDTSVVLMGSWGRAEVTAGSDDDFMVLVDGAERDEVEPPIEAVKTVLDQAPGDQGVFGEPVSATTSSGTSDSTGTTTRI